MKTYSIPGIRHSLTVKYASRRTLLKHNKDLKLDRGDLVEGLYDPDNHIVWVVTQQPEESQKQRLLHELAHHMELEVSNISEEEIRVDTIASWWLRLMNDKVFLELVGIVITGDSK